MSAMRKELNRILICGSVGLIAGLIGGIAYDIDNSFFGASIILPLFFTLYAIGIFYGMKQFSKMLLKVGGLVANGLMEAIAGAFSSNPWQGLVKLIFAFIGLYLVLALGWIPGIYFACKALSDAKSGVSQHEGGGWGEEHVPPQDDWEF